MERFIQLTPLQRFKLTNFNLIDILGKGASGCVYKHIQDNNSYAVKVLNIEDWGEEEEVFYEDLLWQTQIINQLKGLNKSITFFGYDIINENNIEKCVIVMEYLNCKGDLYDYINQEGFWKKVSEYKRYTFNTGSNYTEYIMSFQEKKKISLELIKAVQELHSKDCGIIHGDIKTCNIILDNEKQLKLIYFGASIFCEKGCSLLRTDWHHGTLGYSSPEDQNSCLLGKPSDIYSLGITLIEVWSGKIWGDSEDFRSCRNEALKSLRLIENNDPNIGKLLRKLINLDSKKRPKINKILKDYNNII